MAKRVTLADLARHTGLSTATVSLALNGREGSRIPESTARRVREAAQDLGYVPDATARSLRTGRTQALGFISDEVTLTRFASEMLSGVLDAAEDQSHGVMIMETRHRTEGIADAAATLVGRRVDGLLVGLMASREFDAPEVAGLPVVVVNGVAAGCCSVLPDEDAAGRAAVEFLVARGHRRIALIGAHPVRQPPRLSVNIGVRMAAIDAAMADAGLSFVARHDGVVWEPELGYQGAAEIVDAQVAPTAILAANDRIAFGVYQALSERGLSVPGDVSVLSFDDEELASMVRPGLTTWRLPYREMGEAGVRLLLEQLAGGRPDDVVLRMPLVERGSVTTV